MTKKITVSLPDDIAERLSIESNASAYVAEAVRRRMLSERVREQLRAAGIHITEEDIAKADEEMRQLEERMTPELRQRLVRQMDEVMEKVRSRR